MRDSVFVHIVETKWLYSQLHWCQGLVLYHLNISLNLRFRTFTYELIVICCFLYAASLSHFLDGYLKFWMMCLGENEMALVLVEFRPFARKTLFLSTLHGKNEAIYTQY